MEKIVQYRYMFFENDEIIVEKYRIILKIQKTCRIIFLKLDIENVRGNPIMKQYRN